MNCTPVQQAVASVQRRREVFFEASPVLPSTDRSGDTVQTLARRCRMPVLNVHAQTVEVIPQEPFFHWLTCGDLYRTRYSLA